MTWVARNRERIERIREFVATQEKVPPRIFGYFQGGLEQRLPFPLLSDRGFGALLLHGALNQGLTEEKLDRLLLELFEKYGLDMFRLNRLPFLELEAFFQGKAWLRDWPLLQQAPGILRTACDFFYGNGGILQAIRSNGWHSEKFVSMVAENIFLMGRNSVVRYKARAIACMYALAGGRELHAFWSEGSVVPVGRGHLRLMYTIGPLANRRSSSDRPPEERVIYHNRFYTMLFPGQTFRVHVPFENFLNPGGQEVRCRTVSGGCGECSLQLLCPKASPA